MALSLQAGFREGLEDGKHEFIQQGFDLGFQEAATMGFSAGKLRGIAEAAAAIAALTKADGSDGMQRETAAMKSELAGIKPSQLSEHEAKEAVERLEADNVDTASMVIRQPVCHTALSELEGRATTLLKGVLR